MGTPATSPLSQALGLPTEQDVGGERGRPMSDELMTDDAKLMAVLLRPPQLAQTAWWIAREAGVDPAYAEQALGRMADWTPADGDPSYSVIRRVDLGPDVY